MMKNFQLLKILFLFQFGNIFINGKEFQCDTSFSCGCGETNVQSGEQINPFSWSMIVSIQYNLSTNDKTLSTKYICDGTILTNSLILTSANCIVHFLKDIQKNRIEILTDKSRDLQKRIVDNVLIHPNWTNFLNQYENNIALLHLSEPLNLISQTCISKEESFSKEFIIIEKNQNKFLSKKCSNDIRMGSPLFQWNDNHWEQIGILSNNCKSNSSLNYIQLSFYQKWIHENIQINTKINQNDFSKNYVCTHFQKPCGCGHKNVQFTQTMGHEAVPHSWSMIVSIRRNNTHICSGSILNASFILTSASCIGNLTTFGITVLAGIHHLSDNSGIFRKVDRIYLHPNYTGILNDYVNDISILHISEPFDFNNNSSIKQSCLMQNTYSGIDSSIFPYHMDKLAVIGWGQMPCDNRIQNGSLQQIEIYTGSYFEKYCYVLNEHRNMQFCAGLFNQTTVSCVADPGSPVFEWKYTGWEQVGIASYALDCRQLKQFPIYTRTVEYNKWISSIINDCTTTTTTTTTTTVVTIATTTTTTTTKPPITYSCDSELPCGCSSHSVSLTPSRIVGGENAVESSWSMIASLRLYGIPSHMCGASILSNSYILTAAHCVANVDIYRNVTIRHGVTIAAGMTNISDSKQIVRSVDDIYVHPGYIGRYGGNRHDIAVLHLNEPLNIDINNPLLKKTCLHRVDPPLISHEYIKNGTRLTVIGWGTMKSGESRSPSILQQTEVFAMDNNHPMCQNSMNDSYTQFCAGLYEGGKDSCQGDSGGPIFQWTGKYWEQVGVVSYGYGCAVAGYPGIYTRLSYYYDWIKNIVQTNNEYLEPEFSTNKTSTNIKRYNTNNRK